MAKATSLILILLAAALAGTFFYFQARNRVQAEELAALRQEIAGLRTASAAQGKILAALKKRLTPPPKTAWVGIDDAPMLGKKDAPVTIVEFSEFQCPYCARFAAKTFPELRKQYIDTGKVRFVFRNFPLAFHKNAAEAAEAGACAADQGMFWDLHDLLFQHHDALTEANLKRYGKEAGLFMDDYLFCMESGKNTVQIQKDIQDGKRAGVTGTPSFFIGLTRKDDRIRGTILRGSKPFTAFQSLIEEKLKEASKTPG